jgi:hypothetical protein
MDRIGDTVSHELGRVGGSGESGASGAMAKVVDAWPHAVGGTIARNAWPARIARDGTLHVATDSSAWAFELQQLEAEILNRLRSAVGDGAPTRLRFAVGKLPELGAEDVRSGRRPAPEPTPEQRELADALAARISDDELRKVVAKAAARSLAAAASDRPF